MSLADLLSAVHQNGDNAILVVRTRPSEVGELMQLALSSGNPIVAAMVPRQRSAVIFWERAVRAVNVTYCFEACCASRALGRTRFAAAMHSIVDELHAKQAATDPLHRSMASVDGMDSALAFSAKNPESGKLTANFFDRPDDVVSQLLADDEKTLLRHIQLLGRLIHHSPTTGWFFVRALIAYRGETTRIKRLVACQIDDEVASEFARRAARGKLDDNEGGPEIRAERMAPLLAELVSQPDVAAVLANLQRRDLTGRSDLREILKHVLLASYSKATRTRVRTSIARGAAAMFRDSLLTTDPVDRAR